MEQLSLFANAAPSQAPAAEPDLASYDHIIVAFSGGKDSIACYLHLLERGVDPARIELWHHLIDGREGSTLMDWPITEDYCKQFAEAFGSPIKFSWKVGGFEREMLRDGQRTAPTAFEDGEDNLIECGGTRGKESTRRKFPQVSADLSVRWCSAYLKIDVCTAAIRNQARFNHSRTLVVTGERAEESAARAKYATLEPDKADRRDGRNRRHVDHWRPVHAWKEAQIWDIMQRHQVNPHPAYRLGWGRLSCMACIFGSKHQWASLQAVAPEAHERIARYEEDFGHTIHRDRSVRDLAEEGEAYEALENVDLIAQSQAMVLDEPIINPDWRMPAGAFGDSAGPT